jgi:hypothetical protein
MIPPPASHNWDELRKLDKIVHTNRTTADWAVMIQVSILSIDDGFRHLVCTRYIFVDR